ncbi:MAG: hypothetical protein J0H22_09520, partial [Actinobacteria bacterium]|nr:hypothetical protein [Actinomycetota bacterium]
LGHFGHRLLANSDGRGNVALAEVTARKHTDPFSRPPPPAALAGGAGRPSWCWRSVGSPGEHQFAGAADAEIHVSLSQER